MKMEKKKTYKKKNIQKNKVVIFDSLLHNYTPTYLTQDFYSDLQVSQSRQHTCDVNVPLVTLLQFYLS
jgi:hypothetical protein